MHRSLALLLSVVLTVAGCASYTPKSLAAPTAGKMPAWKTDNGVSVGADPYAQTARQKEVFDADLGKEGIIPVQVFVRNENSRRLLVRPSSMNLVLPDGTQLASTGATAVASQLDQGMGEVIGWSVAFGLIGMLAASANKDKVRTARLTDYRGKELVEVPLVQDESAHGFVFFIPPKGTGPLTEAMLAVRFVDVADATSFDVRLPLRGLDFKGAPAPSR